MATNMYIKFTPEIKTDVKVEGQEGTLEILSWNHGFSQPTSPVRSSGGGGTVERANHQNLSFSKYLDGATQELIKKCWGGKQFDSAVLTCYRASDEAKPVKYLEVTMEHVLIANYSVSGGPGDIPVSITSALRSIRAHSASACSSVIRPDLTAALIRRAAASMRFFIMPCSSIAVRSLPVAPFSACIMACAWAIVSSPSLMASPRRRSTASKS